MNKKINILFCIILVFILGEGCKDKNLVIIDDFEEVIEIDNKDTEIPKVKEIEELIVEIKGEVLNPGVYKVKEGDRLNDLLILAGGKTENAYLRNTNLALKILDGESFYIPKIGEEDVNLIIPGNNGSGVGMSSTEKELIDLNKATREELITVPGIGPQTAENILNYREESGSFKSVDDLLNVNRIGEKTLEKLKGYFVVK